jgi:predicted dehydrogenase
MPASRIRWGILSTARIGLERVIPAMKDSSYAVVAAIASRDRDRANAAAGELGIPQAYGSYEELLADPDIDVIYNPLPNHLHVQLSLDALRQGKHVLCEKPLAMSAAEAALLADAAAEHPHLKVMEAFMYRFHPQWARVGEILEAGTIGELRSVHSHFSFFNDDPENIRNRQETGGGALMDVGCYNLSVSRLLFGREPERISATSRIDSRFGTDYIVSGVLDFGRGTATFTCGTQLQHRQQVVVIGSEGMLEVNRPFTPAPDERCRIVLTKGELSEEITVEPANQYTIQADLFSRAVLHDEPVPTPLEDALGNMRALDAVVQSIRSGGPVAPSSCDRT